MRIAHGVIKARIFTHEPVPGAEGMDLPFNPAPIQVSTERPVGKKCFYVAKYRLNLLSLIIRWVRDEMLLIDKPTVAKVGHRIFILRGFSAAVEEGFHYKINDIS